RACLSLYFTDSCADHLSLRSFPTRRSSDLEIGEDAAVVRVAGDVAPSDVVARPLDREGDIRGGGRGDALQDGILVELDDAGVVQDRKSTRLNSSHVKISYAVFCLKKKKKKY